MSSKKGVSMLIMAITVVVLIIISSTVIFSSSAITQKTKLKKFGTEMLQVKSAVSQYVKRNSGDIDWDTYNIETASMTTEEIEQYIDEDLTSEDNLYIVNLKDIGAETANYGLGYKTLQDQDIYLWSKKTDKIYYKKGYIYDEKTYYTLTSELMELIK